MAASLIVASGLLSCGTSKEPGGEVVISKGSTGASVSTVVAPVASVPSVASVGTASTLSGAARVLVALTSVQSKMLIMLSSENLPRTHV